MTFFLNVDEWPTPHHVATKIKGFTDFVDHNGLKDISSVKAITGFNSLKTLTMLTNFALGAYNRSTI